MSLVRPSGGYLRDLPSLSPVAEPGPDGTGISDDIICPRCEYNLRGLAELRCPECGYRCTWLDLLEAGRQRHPYLFEENPKRNVASFVRTFVATFFPCRFWTSLKPSHPPRPRRLALYWMVAAALAVFAWFALVASLLLYEEWQFRTVWQNYVQFVIEFSGGIMIQAAAICIAWPFATYATLMIFLGSMRRANVRPIDVLRCVIYGCNSAVWIGLLISVLLPVGRSRIVMPEICARAVPPMIIATAMGLVAFYHLGSAYRQYLKFDHPWATAAASQMIVWMLACVAAGSL